MGSNQSECPRRSHAQGARNFALCADAYVLLAEQGQSAGEALEYYQKNVEAGEQALGAKEFKEYAGNFWGFLETRPYMGARAGLAATLNSLGEVQSAISHYQDMLERIPVTFEHSQHAEKSFCILAR